MITWADRPQMNCTGCPCRCSQVQHDASHRLSVTSDTQPATTNTSQTQSLTTKDNLSVTVTDNTHIHTYCFNLHVTGKPLLAQLNMS